MPDQLNGVPQIPLHGASIAPTFADAAAPAPRSVQYFEQMGHRGIWADGWKATTYHEPGQSYDDDHWGLFHLDEDFAECNDLAEEHPDKLAELVAPWWERSERHGVLPLDDRTVELFGSAPRPGTVHARSEYVYRPPLSHMYAAAATPPGCRSGTFHSTVAVPADGG